MEGRAFACPFFVEKTSGKSWWQARGARHLCWRRRGWLARRACHLHL